MTEVARIRGTAGQNANEEKQGDLNATDLGYSRRRLWKRLCVVLLEDSEAVGYAP